MSTWGNPVVKRLADGDAMSNDFHGMVLVCSWPMPAAVQKQYDAFRKELSGALPDEAYVYPTSTLHCTVCTLRERSEILLHPPTLHRVHTACDTACGFYAPA